MMSKAKLKDKIIDFEVEKELNRSIKRELIEDKEYIHKNIKKEYLAQVKDGYFDHQQRFYKDPIFAQQNPAESEELNNSDDSRGNELRNLEFIEQKQSKLQPLKNDPLDK